MYAVRLTKDAEADLARLDRMIVDRVLKRIRWLAENFESVTPLPLTGQWQGYYKLRVGDYRIIYRVQQEEDSTLIIEFVRHRREVYR